MHSTASHDAGQVVRAAGRLPTVSLALGDELGQANAPLAVSTISPVDFVARVTAEAGRVTSRTLFTQHAYSTGDHVFIGSEATQPPSPDGAPAVGAIPEAVPPLSSPASPMDSPDRRAGEVLRPAESLMPAQQKPPSDSPKMPSHRPKPGRGKLPRAQHKAAELAEAEQHRTALAVKLALEQQATREKTGQPLPSSRPMRGKGKLGKGMTDAEAERAADKAIQKDLREKLKASEAKNAANKAQEEARASRELNLLSALDQERREKQALQKQVAAYANKDGYFGQAFVMSAQQTECRNARLGGKTGGSDKTLLYHQTSAKATEAIIQSGKMKVGSQGTAGGGIYFACTEKVPHTI